MKRETIIIKSKGGLVYSQIIKSESQESRIERIFFATIKPIPDSLVGKEYNVPDENDFSKYTTRAIFPAYPTLKMGESFWIAETDQELSALGERTGYLTRYSARESGDSASIMDNEDLRKFEESYSVTWIQMENKGPICFQSQPIKPF